LASMTKIITAMVLMDLEPDWNKIITIKKSHLDYPKLYVGNDTTSEVNLAVGDVMTFYDLWSAMLVASSNQGTAALVDSTGLTVAEFVELMNEKTKSLGLKKTKFYDVAGLNAHNVTTPKEMAKLAYAAFSIPEIAQASQNRTYIIKATTVDGVPKEIRVVDRNFSLWNFGAESAKTGYLVEAQRTVATKKGNNIVVIMHALSMAQRNEILGKLLK
jgi:serine-type D-Ala-D-Ala endopeptidase (penicillin-binding protein 7)